MIGDTIKRILGSGSENARVTFTMLKGGMVNVEAAVLVSDKEQLAEASGPVPEAKAPFVLQCLLTDIALTLQHRREKGLAYSPLPWIT